jgi:hypothetical protein
MKFQIRYVFSPTVETFTDRAAFLRRQYVLADWGIRFEASVIG